MTPHDNSNVVLESIENYTPVIVQKSRRYTMSRMKHKSKSYLTLEKSQIKMNKQTNERINVK